MLTIAMDIALFGLGLIIVVLTLLSAVRTLILPRSAPDILVRWVFICLRRFFAVRLRWAKTYHERDRILAFYSPVGLLILLPVWLTTTLLAFMLMNWATTE